MDIANLSDTATGALERLNSRRRGRQRRVLWFNTSHERNLVPLLDPLASAREPARGMIGETSDLAGRGVEYNKPGYQVRPLFDEAWFMELAPGRPSRFTPATAKEILQPYGLSTTTVESMKEATPAAKRRNNSTSLCRPNEDRGKEGGTASSNEQPRRAAEAMGGWQQTLEQVIYFRVLLYRC